MNRKIGRPLLGENEAEIIASKLAPYLQAGLSLYKACLEAKVNRATVYRLMGRDGVFETKIKRFQQFLSVITANTISRELINIVKKQQEGQELNGDELEFLQWFALNSNCTREEFGRKTAEGLFDPGLEIQKIKSIIDSATL